MQRKGETQEVYRTKILTLFLSYANAGNKHKNH